MNTYENIVILNSALSEEELQSAKAKIAGLITESEGKILKVDDWGLRKLAYEVNKQKKGYFVLFLFNAPSPVIKKMESYYKVYDPVIKFMFVKLGKKEIAAVEADMRKAAESQAAELPAGVKENV